MFLRCQWAQDEQTDKATGGALSEVALTGWEFRAFQIVTLFRVDLVQFRFIYAFLCCLINLILQSALFIIIKYNSEAGSAACFMRKAKGKQAYNLYDFVTVSGHTSVCSILTGLTCSALLPRQRGTRWLMFKRNWLMGAETDYFEYTSSTLLWTFQGTLLRWARMSCWS